MSGDVFVLEVEPLLAHAQRHREHYAHADPFPHAVIDNFLPEEIADQALQHFPDPNSPVYFDWRSRDQRLQDRKLGIGNAKRLVRAPAYIQQALFSLNSYPILYFLEALTGIPSLLADPYFIGGGLHQILPGGKLAIHADFNYEENLQLYRRVNLLLYLNKNWKEEYGGHLELWAPDMSRCVKKVLPIFNRCVIFNTSLDSYHGHPEPLTTPEGVTRKSLATYYYSRTPTKGDEQNHPTLWQHRPGYGGNQY